MPAHHTDRQTCAHIHTHTSKAHADTHLIPGTKNASSEHEEVSHGDQTGPYKEREEAEHPLEDGLYTDEDEDGQEEEEGGWHGDQECQVFLHVLQGRGDRRKREEVWGYMYMYS